MSRTAWRPGGFVRRWSRRVGIAVLALIVAVTLAAIGFDIATSGDYAS